MLLCLSAFILKTVLITQQDVSSKDPNDMFSKLFREQTKKEQVNSSHRAMSGNQSTFLSDCPKRYTFGKWSIAHTLWVPRSPDVNLMGGKQKR